MRRACRAAALNQPERLLRRSKIPAVEEQRFLQTKTARDDGGHEIDGGDAAVEYFNQLALNVTALAARRPNLLSNSLAQGVDR
jgi:hypothetical protein